GAEILDAPFQAAPGLIGGITDAVDEATGRIGGFITSITEIDLSPLSGVWGQMTDIWDRLAGIGMVLAPAIADLAGAIGVATAPLGLSTWSLFLGIVEALLPVIEFITDVLAVTAQFPADNQVLVTALVGAWTAWRVAMIVATAVKVGFLTYMGVANGLWLGQKVAIEGSTIATAANRIALVAHQAATKAWAAATTIAAGAMKGLKLALDFVARHPIITAVTLITTALVVFFTQTEIGQRIWQGFIGALQVAWEW